MAESTPHAPRAPGRRRQPALRWARRIAWVVVPLALLGEAGHQVLGGLGQVVAHHWFHILFAGGAAAVFLAYAIVDIRRHGWPEFTWRVKPRGSPASGSTTSR